MFIIICLFGLGFMSCIAGCVRTYYMYMVLKTWDTTWASFPVWVSAAVELYIGIVRPHLPLKSEASQLTKLVPQICASIPATKPFFTTYLPAVFGSLTSFSMSHPSTSAKSANNKGASHLTPNITMKDSEMVDLEKGFGCDSAIKSTITVSSVASAGRQDDHSSIMSACSDYNSYAIKNGGGIRVTQTVDQLSDADGSSLKS